MDLETENRIAAILLKEAAELRREAQKEGALAYLRQPTVRSRPNSRFLTATVRGVQQANRAVEISEMWRIRDKQIELDNRLRESRNRSRSTRAQGNVSESHRSKSRNCRDNGRATSPGFSSEERSMADEGLRDNEIEEFLHSRTKRGRGAVGSRMDEAGPYLPSCPNSQRNGSESPDWRIKRARTILGPEKPASLKYSESSDDELRQDKKKKKKMKMGSSELKNKKHKSKGKHRDGKKKKRRETGE